MDEKSTACPLMKIADLATYLGVSESWIKQNPNAIPYVRLGKKHKRWRKADADSYIANNLRGARTR